MQLKILFVLSLCISLSGHAQKSDNLPNVFKIENGESLYKQIYKSISIHRDTLEASFDQKGVFFLRFYLEKNRIKNIICSETEPGLLIDIITGILSRERLGNDETNLNNSFFVLPVLYDFTSDSGKKTGSLKDLLKRIPLVDLDNFTIKTVNKFNQLFGIEDSSETNLFAVNCVFMPWITLTNTQKIE